MDQGTLEKSVDSVPLAAGDLGGEWLEADLFPLLSLDRGHRLLAVPGAVVSYNAPGSTRIHALVH